MPWYFAGLQLVLLFIQMSNQACNSCDQLLEEGELSGEGAAPGLLPSHSRLLSVHLSSLSFLLLTPSLGFFSIFLFASLLRFFFFLSSSLISPWAIGSHHALT